MTERTIDFDKTIILSQTKDSLIVETEELTNALITLQSFWRHLIDSIEDDYIQYGLRCERYILCFWKNGFWEEYLASLK